MLKLQFKDRRRESVWLVDQVFSIGKDTSNSLMVDNSSVSDFHAEIVSQGDKLTLVNKCQGIGVWVNGLPISDEIALKAGDAITLGEVELELIDPKQGKSSPAPSSKSPTSDWSISSKASWLEKSKYGVEDKIVIGRDPSCDIVVPLEHLSRQHVCLEVRNGQLFVKDLESANGTYLNGERVKEAPLKAGDKLKLDVITFEVNGPTHDPHKTIIRTVSSPKKTKVREDDKAPEKPSSTQKPAARKNAKQVKKLAASGKQDWISGESTQTPPKKSNSTGIFIVIGVVLIAAAAFVILSQSK